MVYENITGVQYGVDRSFVDINGNPALLVLSKDSLYFTLAVKGREVLIDCVYFDKRNSLNGARMTAGMCEVDVTLVDTYDDIARRYSNIWSESIYSFDTKALLDGGVDETFLLGRIGEVEVFDRYPSTGSLESSSPQKLIRSRAGCFNLGNAVGFLIFVNKDKPSLKYLDVLRSEEPIEFQRMQEQDLKRIAIEKCDM